MPRIFTFNPSRHRRHWKATLPCLLALVNLASLEASLAGYKSRSRALVYLLSYNNFPSTLNICLSLDLQHHPQLQLSSRESFARSTIEEPFSPS
ncbi:hypothetical protein N431DRAFT_203315 [Stipitochalara longipes BDJ]|nr:hypothetical protein N431DRAFT_203315 [Stipitochalara longipes BDJ]